MSKTIRKLYMMRKFNEAYYQLSPEARDLFWQRIQKDEISLGAKLLISCDSRWSGEVYAGWGVIEYPDIQAVQKTTALNEKNELFRYVESETYLGQPMDLGTLFIGIEDVKDTSDTVYQLFLMKNQDNDAGESLPKAVRDHLFAGVIESIKKYGGKGLFACQIDWSNEEYVAYGITAWPNIEALQAHFEDLQKIDWHRYNYAKTILGKKSE